jgi:hypothetical protein
MDRKRGREEEGAGGGTQGGEISLSIEETNRCVRWNMHAG